MNISEIIDMTQKKTISEIAKEHLTIGEKPARKALKLAGCYSIVGRAGWFFDESENPENLNKSIYYFSDKVKELENEALKDRANVYSNDGTGQVYVPRKRHSFDLDVRLVKELKLHCVKSDITLYEAVESAIRNYLDGDKQL